MKRLAGVVWLVLLLAPVPVAAQDLSGNWFGSINVTFSDGETNDAQIYIVVKQNGVELTGTAGDGPADSGDRQMAIHQGKIEGNKVTFELHKNESVMKFELALVNGHLQGQAKSVSGKPWKAVVDLQRITSPAQEQEIRKAVEKATAEKGLLKELALQVDTFKILGAKFGFETKLVKGAPYSATAEAETIQPLVDGNRIVSKNTTAVYRDSEGRTRREITGKKNGIAAQIYISDPAAGANYVLETLPRIAIKSQLHPKELELIKMKVAAEEKAKAAKPGQPETKEEILKRYQESGATIRVDPDGSVHATRDGGKALESGQIARVGGMDNEKPQPITESLGKQVVEGIECEGRRTTVTIPAGQIGNDLPIKFVREQWYSPELQVLVLTRELDPRSGETTYRLTNINRGEPDRSLFEVPGDYTVKEERYVMKQRNPSIKPEEEQ